MLSIYPILTGIYEAQLRKIEVGNPEKNPGDINAWFWIPELNQTVCFRTGLGIPRVRNSIEYLCHFLKNSDEGVGLDNFADFVGRWCKLSIRLIHSYGNGYPCLTSISHSDRIDAVNGDYKNVK